MTQLYSREKSNDPKNAPKKETVQFLLDFSKSLKVIKSNSNRIIELNLN